MNRACPVEGCGKAIDAGRLFCARCWPKTPFLLRREIVRHLRMVRAAVGDRRRRHRRAALRLAQDAAVIMAAERTGPRRQKKAHPEREENP